MSTFNFAFDELPLVIVNGIEAGFINGEAELEYTRNGEWTVVSITLDGQSIMVNGKRTWPQISAPDAIAAVIDNRLNKEWRDKVQEAVREQLAADREDALEQRADMRRDERRGL